MKEIVGKFKRSKLFQGNIFPVLLLVSLTFSSCFNDNDSRRLLYAEINIEKDSLRAKEAFEGLSDSFDSDPLFYIIHDDDCYLNLYYYQIEKHIKEGQLKQARESLHQYLETAILIANRGYHKEDPYWKRLIQNTYQYLDLLTIANLKRDTLNSANEELISQLKTITPRHPSQHQQINSAFERKLLNSGLYIPSILILTIIIIALVLYQRKNAKYQRHLSKYIEQREKDNREITGLNEQMDNLKTHLSKLTRQSERLRDSVNEKIGAGKIVYDRLVAGGNMKNISIEQEQNFIDYYSFSHPEKFSMIVNQYSNLSLRHLTYLILLDMGYSDQQIQEILFVKASTIRNYRLRIKKHRK